MPAFRELEVPRSGDIPAVAGAAGSQGVPGLDVLGRRAGGEHRQHVGGGDGGDGAEEARVGLGTEGEDAAR